MTNQHLIKDAVSIDIRVVEQPTSFTSRRHQTIDALYRHAHRDPMGFWDHQARQLTWQTPWQRVLDWNRPHAKWFSGGQLNASQNCLDVHLDEWGNKDAIIWESETGEVVRYTYHELSRHVNQLANGLVSMGVSKGDSVTIYMPLVPEAVMAMLAWT